MGYYSNVTFVTTEEGYAQLMKEMDRTNDEYEVAKKSTPLLARGTDPCKLEHIAECVVFGWPSIKWYRDFCDVKAVESALRKIEEKGYPVEWLIIGEEIGDIEYSGVSDGLKIHVEPDCKPSVWTE